MSKYKITPLELSDLYEDHSINIISKNDKYIAYLHIVEPGYVNIAFDNSNCYHDYDGPCDETIIHRTYLPYQIFLSCIDYNVNKPGLKYILPMDSLYFFCQKNPLNNSKAKLYWPYLPNLTSCTFTDIKNGHLKRDFYQICMGDDYMDDYDRSIIKKDSEISKYVFDFYKDFLNIIFNDDTMSATIKNSKTPRSYDQYVLKEFTEKLISKSNNLDKYYREEYKGSLTLNQLFDLTI